MNAAVVVPVDIRAQSRRRAWSHVAAHLVDVGLPVLASPMPPGPPATAIARARNDGAHWLGADAAGIDVLVFNDADTLAPAERILEAAVLALEAPGLVFAFDTYCRLSYDTTLRVFAGDVDAFEAPVAWDMFGSLSSGCVAISRACFRRVGGYDEGYERGYEDCDFAMRCAARWAPRRVAGELIHLWHERPPVEPETFAPDHARYLERVAA